MKSFTISAAVAILAALASAVPTPANQARTFMVTVKFYGADPPAYFQQEFPGDGQVVKIDNPLSISKIESQGGGTCNFRGVDGSSTTTVGRQTVDVGPPQRQISGVCRAF